jgi:very-short-patch-repair endonuclease
MKQRARELRTRSTDAERRLWHYLRAHRLGYKFKRQVPIECYIVDFVCYEKRLIIELDGGQHQDQQAYDTQRTAVLSKKGFRVLRFWNHEVLQHIEAVLEVIHQALSPTLSREQVQRSYSNSFRGRGGIQC